MTLTREELLRGKALIEESFRRPWHYEEFHIDCVTCEGGTTSPCNGKEFTECTNPECDGTHSPATFVMAGDDYVVATIDVPGVSSVADKNGACICWLRNHATELIAGNLALNELRGALVFLCSDPSVAATRERIIEYAESLGWKRPSP